MDEQLMNDRNTAVLTRFRGVVEGEDPVTCFFDYRRREIYQPGPDGEPDLETRRKMPRKLVESILVLFGSMERAERGEILSEEEISANAKRMWLVDESIDA